MKCPNCGYQSEEEKQDAEFLKKVYSLLAQGKKEELIKIIKGKN